VTSSVAEDSNYAAGSASAAFTIAKVTLTGSFTAQDKEYDGNNSAAVSGRSVSGKLGNEDVSLSGGTATFANANVGTGKTVSLVGATLTGSAAGNYTLGSVSTTAAKITGKALTGSFTAQDKEYDGSTTATVASRSVSGMVGSDDVNLSGGTATFANANVGTDKTVTLAGATLSGSAAGNYTLGSVSTTTAKVTAKSLTGSFTAANKKYDGNVSATVTGRSVVGKIGSDDVSLSGGTATFADENIGTGKTVTLTGASLVGTAAGNYTLASVSTATADIKPAGPTFEDSYNGKNMSDIAPNGLTYLLNYAFGGSDTTAPRLPVQDTSDPAKLTLVAYVRTGDDTLSVVGEVSGELPTFDSNNTIAGDVVSPSDAPDGMEMRKYSVSVSGDRKFLRLKATKQ